MENSTGFLHLLFESFPEVLSTFVTYFASVSYHASNYVDKSSREWKQIVIRIFAEVLTLKNDDVDGDCYYD